MFFKHAFHIFFVILLVNTVNTSNPKLNIEVLFEALCPDSIRFITEQLYPVWNDVQPYINLKFTPFGKSSSLDGGAKFVCQHGPRECKGNRLMSCGLSLTHDPNAQMEFVNCFMKKFHNRKNHQFETTQHCASEAGLSFDEIHQCYGSSQGTQLQLLAEQSTISFKPQFVPTILYNGQFVQQAQDASIEDFKGFICTILKQTYPEACSHQSVVNL